MTRARIGSHVMDSTRRELGVGVLQLWTHYPAIGRCARVKFDTGLRFVREKNMCYPRQPPEPTVVISDEEAKLMSRKFGLTVRQYREAMGA